MAKGRGFFRRIFGGKPRGGPRGSNSPLRISDQEAADFLDGGSPLFVNSSNVRLVQYFAESSQMLVEYGNGHSYLYEDVTYDEAQAFVTAPSKGEWVWDVLRVRGSKTAHRKRYTHIK